jgi:hypothetical protein
MPWKYVLPTDVESLREREAALLRIAKFWNEFAAKLPDIEAHLGGQSQWNLADWMNAHVADIHPRLRWEFGQDLSGRSLVITCEAAYHLRPMTETVCKTAPTIPGWTFRDFRPACEVEELAALVRQRTGLQLTTTAVFARMGSGRRIDITFENHLAKTDHDAAMNMARVACDYLFGEDIVQRWIGHLEVVEISHAFQNFVPLGRIRGLVLELIGTTLGTMPDRPYWKMPPIAMTETKYRPEKRADYANQDDVIYTTTAIPELRTAAFKPGFCSCRFSRQGEMFCYLKIDGSDVDLEPRYNRKKVIEETLNNKLREDGIGAIVGSGTGRKYLYFELAVTDIAKTFEAIRRRLLALELLPVGSWILFYDSDLAGEYIGLRTATPKPPMWREPEDVLLTAEQEEVAEEEERPQIMPSEPVPVTGGLDNPNWMMDPLS